MKLNLQNFDAHFAETTHQLCSLRSLFTLTSSYRLRFYFQKNLDNLQKVLRYLLGLCEDRLKLISRDLQMIATNDGFIYSLLSAICVALEFLDLQSTS